MIARVGTAGGIPINDDAPLDATHVGDREALLVFSPAGDIFIRRLCE